MNLYFRNLLLPIALAALSACSVLPPSRQPAAPAEQTPMPAPGADARDNLMFEILLGEVAGQREQLDVSVQQYLRAAERSDDPRIAERALRIAVFAKQEDAALSAICCGIRRTKCRSIKASPACSRAMKIVSWR
ncbi:MAG: hypothetical protein HZB57_09125 [Gammaproteobacteria bacterium]|nr:hypothetical protein [Gammaproteobacteria bacterium]